MMRTLQPEENSIIRGIDAPLAGADVLVVRRDPAADQNRIYEVLYVGLELRRLHPQRHPRSHRGRVGRIAPDWATLVHDVASRGRIRALGIRLRLVVRLIESRIGIAANAEIEHLI